MNNMPPPPQANPLLALRSHTPWMVVTTIIRFCLVITVLAFLPLMWRMGADRFKRWWGWDDAAAAAAADAAAADSSDAMRTLTSTDNDYSPEELGGETDRYTWTQSETEVDVTVAVPAGTAAKDVRCDLLPTRVALRIKGDIVLEGDFFKAVVSDESVWMMGAWLFMAAASAGAVDVRQQNRAAERAPRPPPHTLAGLRLGSVLGVVSLLAFCVVGVVISFASAWWLDDA